MYYRRKVILALLEALDREVDKTAFQKYLFLVSAEQKRAAYDFVPCRDGCFSFQADADKKTLTKYGYLKDRDRWALVRKQHFLRSLENGDRQAISRVADRAGNLSRRELIRHEKILWKQIASARPAVRAQARLFTIGYEGQSLERYLNQFIEQGIKVLCDVRCNPVSMKFGFSKRQLQSAVHEIGITYVPLPELGIESSKRCNLNSPEDYEILFKEYAKTTLARNTETLLRIMDLIKRYRRVALTCFEANYESCHRGCIAEVLKRRHDFRHRVVHL